MKNYTKTITASVCLCLMVILSINFVFAASLSLSLGSYDSEIYNQETINIPVTVTASNVTGSADVTLSPKTGLSCSTCTLSYTFTGASSEQGTVTFTLTGTQTGTYNPPFNSISAVSGSTSATPLSSGDPVTVIERPTWVTSLEASDSTPESGDQVILTLEITPSGTFEGVVADLSLSSGLSLVSGSDPTTIGTISGTSTYQWTVTATSTGTASVALSATDPSESGTENTETVTLTVPGGGSSSGSGSSSSGGGSIVSKWVKEIKLNGSELNLGQTLKQLKKNYRMTFNISGMGHYLGITNVTSTSVTIEIASTPQTATLLVGETKKFEVTGDDYYDISVRLDSIFNSTDANITIKGLYEKISADTTPVAGVDGTTSSSSSSTGGGADTGPGSSDAPRSLAWVWWLLLAIIIIIVVIIIVIRSKNTKEFNKKMTYISKKK